ncbi:hypothetical protein M0805_006572 [Coniferiporia weirii]|nr:hypothetical protein M0805_006572 [Coniferiporia weirii]
MVFHTEYNLRLREKKRDSPLIGPENLLLIVFIHGFIGSDSAFAEFPKMLQHIVAENNKNYVVESIVFPTYPSNAVENLKTWLAVQVASRESFRDGDGGAQTVKVVLCGHRLHGGLIAADTLIGLVTSCSERGEPLRPNIIACIGFDTPYFGLRRLEFKKKAGRVVRIVRAAHQVASTFGALLGSSSSMSPDRYVAATISTAVQASAPVLSWGRWIAPAAYVAGGLLLCGAAAGAAYVRRRDIEEGYKWAADHLKYVGVLWDENSLAGRVGRLVEIEASREVLFRNLYTLLPAKPPDYYDNRTFIDLPPPDNSPLNSKFLFARNSIAKDEIQAHTGMFKPSTNDGYHRLGSKAGEIIKDAITAQSRVEWVEQKWFF